MIDKEAVRIVSNWLRLGDRASGRPSIDGRCDRCGGAGYLSRVDQERLCPSCVLEGDAGGS